MSKREEYNTFINVLRTASPTITDEQRKGFVRLGVQQYGLTVDEASDVLYTSGIQIGEQFDYFQVLGLSISEFENRSEEDIALCVKSAHKKLYAESLQAGGRPRADGKSEAEWRTVLNQARDTLVDSERRLEHLSTIQQENIPLDKEVKTPNLENMALIPEGEFQMGSEDEEAYGDEHPAHTVYLDAFYIDKYLVTNEQYKAFVDENPEWSRQNIPHEYGDVDYLKHWRSNSFPISQAGHPVVNVSWYAAMAYSQWVGKRLPTEAEWEKAARGGKSRNKYPWGDIADPSMANYDWNIGETTTVGEYPSNEFDLYDMCGNVWEWCLDAYHESVAMGTTPRNPIVGAKSVEWIVNHSINVKSNRVLRGGSWRIPASLVRIANRNAESPSFSLNVIGFRCVCSVPSGHSAKSQSVGIQLNIPNS